MTNTLKMVNEYGKKIYSQFGEDGIINEILNRLKNDNLDKYCVEFGARDGVSDSNTYNLIKNHNYKAVLIEGDKKYFKKLCKNFSSDEIIKLNKIYQEILLKIKDNSIKDSVLSNHQFQYKFYKKIENKILKFEKNNYKVFLNQISKLHEDLFPFGVLQERFYNFSTFYFYIGEDILKILKNNIDPLDCNFVVLSAKVDDNAK